MVDMESRDGEVPIPTIERKDDESAVAYHARVLKRLDEIDGPVMQGGEEFVQEWVFTTVMAAVLKRDVATAVTYRDGARLLSDEEVMIEFAESVDSESSERALRELHDIPECEGGSAGSFEPLIDWFEAEQEKHVTREEWNEE